MSSGHCFWEKTSNGCKDEDDTFTHNAYDFYELCRAGKRKGATFNCEKAPLKLTAGQCKDRKDGAVKNWHKQKESSKGQADKDDNYVIGQIEKKFCYDCEQRRWICRSLGCRGMFENLL